MKQEPTKQAMPPANSQDDPLLWDVLGKGTPAAAPEDFLSKVMTQVDELQAGGARKSRRHPSLVERWDSLLDAFLDLCGSNGFRLAGALAILTITCLIALGPNLSPKATVGSGVAKVSSPYAEPRMGARGPLRSAQRQDAEMNTILQLDDLLAFADQQAFLDTDSGSSLR